jgi:hypothetical protein
VANADAHVLLRVGVEVEHDPPPVSVKIEPLNPPMSPFCTTPFSISPVATLLNSSMRMAE